MWNVADGKYFSIILNILSAKYPGSNENHTLWWTVQTKQNMIFPFVEVFQHPITIYFVSNWAGFKLSWGFN